MKRSSMKYALLLSVFFAVLAQGCTKEKETTPTGVGGDGLPVTVFVKSPATRSDEIIDPNAMEGDYDIVDFRVMVFRYGGGEIVRNIYIPDIWALTVENNIEIFDILTGVYDFLFIANEKAGAASSALNTRLNGYSPGASEKFDLDDVLKEYFPYTDFDADRPIPMTGLYRNVAISGDNTLTYTEDGSTRQVIDAVWPVRVQRLGVRLGLKFITNHAELASNASGFSIRVPEKVYIINDKTGSTYGNPNNTGTLAEETAEVAFSTDDHGTFTESDGSMAYEWKIPRVILPENTFNPVSQQERAMRVGVHFEGNISTLYGSVGYDISSDDYTAPRNYIYNLTGTLRDAIRFDGTVNQWGGNSPEIDLTDEIDELEPASNCYVVKPDSNPVGIPVSMLADSRLSSRIVMTNLSKLRADILWSDTRGMVTAGAKAPR